MCSQYTLKTPLLKIAQAFGANLPDSPDSFPLDFSKDLKVLPHLEAPVILVRNGQIVLDVFRYSLIPSWSKEERLKFATHNARIETIDSKAMWKAASAERHCIVPLDAFFEAVYEGHYAGNMLRFEKNSAELLYAAGIFELWKNSSSGELIKSFAIITEDACPFIKEAGHDRQPVFLSASMARKWLTAPATTAKNTRMFLDSLKSGTDFSLSIERPLKAGWEKRRIPNQRTS